MAWHDTSRRAVADDADDRGMMWLVVCGCASALPFKSPDSIREWDDFRAKRQRPVRLSSSVFPLVVSCIEEATTA